MQRLYPSEVIEKLILADGDLDLVAERLKIDKNSILSCICTDPFSSHVLSSQMRLATTLKIFELMNQVIVALQAGLPGLEPYEMVKTFNSLVSMLNNFTTEVKAPSTDNAQIILNMLPREAQEAIVALTSPKVITDGINSTRGN